MMPRGRKGRVLIFTKQKKSPLNVKTMLNLVQVSIEFSYAMPESKKKIVLEDTKTVATYRSALLFLGQGFESISTLKTITF